MMLGKWTKPDDDELKILRFKHISLMDAKDDQQLTSQSPVVSDTMYMTTSFEF